MDLHFRVLHPRSVICLFIPIRERSVREADAKLHCVIKDAVPVDALGLVSHILSRRLGHGRTIKSALISPMYSSKSRQPGRLLRCLASLSVFCERIAPTLRSGREIFIQFDINMQTSRLNLWWQVL